MWMMVFFDLPTETKRDRRNAAGFRKRLIQDGFTMMQFSVYVRHCSSSENMEVHRKRVKKSLPPKGSVNILTVTDNQFGRMEIFYNTKPREKVEVPQQLELF
ncbi:MAG: CRISPR-associated endonuclease Cas2 [Cyclobacteriaceae bacterium]|nr:CRISPR-associated endonuclease Cas2 [Cyclobacteriaceae bacterium]